MIWAIILAAGESKRMGKQKLLLPFGKKTIVETVIDNVIQSRVEKALVVLGANRDEIENKIRELPIKIVFNPNFSTGMLSSIKKGFQEAPETVQAVLIMLGDQPSISAVTINKVIDTYEKTKKGIILPIYKNERGHPILIDMKYRKEVENLNPEIGLRELVYRQSEDILEVDVEASAIINDIDDMKDYEREIKK